MTDTDDIDALAAEYVLGTLDLSERSSVAARLGREPRLAAAIEAWERRLGPLNELVPAVEPPREIWAGIERRIQRTETVATGAAAASSSTGAQSNVVDLSQRLQRWRRLAIGATALAASLLVAIGVRETTRTQMPRNYVAVFQKDDALPAFLLSIDLETRQLSIQPVAAQTPPGKTYQLWIAAEALGGKPRSLGLVEDKGGTTRSALSAFDPSVVQSATFGVSLEPAGGSPTGQPTGPVFHAKLIPATR